MDLVFNYGIQIYMKANRINFYFLLLSVLLLIPGAAYGQDEPLTVQERIKLEQIRDSLTQRGFFQKSSEIIDPEAATSGFVLSEAFYTDKKLKVKTLSSRSTDFRPDGRRFYILGRGKEIIVEYHLDEPWQIDTAEYVREFSTANELDATDQRSASHGLFFRKSDGERMWMLNRTEIWEYTLSNPWDVTSAKQTGYKDLSDVVVRGHDIDFKPDGSVLYVDDRILGVVHQFELSSDWDVETASLDYAFDISDIQQAVRGTQFSPDGKKMFMMDTGLQKVLEFNVSTPFDLRSGRYEGAFNVASEAKSPEGLTFKPDLTAFYVTANFENVVHQYYIYKIDPHESSVVTREDELEANGDDYNVVTVTLRNEDGVRLPNLKVRLEVDGEDLEVQAINKFTDEDGEAVFRVRTSTPQQVEYTAIAEKNSKDIELDDNPQVRFLPEAPVALSASNVQERQFTANWEIVSGVSNYILDVATDDDFENILNNYDALDVGEVTSYTVTGLSPGNMYYYRLRSEVNGISGVNSEEIDVTTFPDVPFVTSPESISATKFVAQWQEAEGANEYILDVSLDENFSEFVQGYDNLNVGAQLEYTVDNLMPGTEYYYRLKSTAFSQVSNASETIQTSTFDVGLDETELLSSQLRVLANGEQENIITLTLRTPDGIIIKGEDVILEAQNGDSEIEVLQGVTDENGEVKYSVTNNTAEEVTYRAVISRNLGIGTISVEFLPVMNELSLGENYPNPFNRQTTIPVSVPNRMRIKITVSNVLGASVKTVIDEDLETGYYEIPVNLGDVASGTYFYRLMTDDQMKTKKMLLVK